MPSNEPEIVTREQVIGKEDVAIYDSDGSKLYTETMWKNACNTIELFTGLLEEECECDDERGILTKVVWTKCVACQRKAAALRRYRGE